MTDLQTGTDLVVIETLTPMIVFAPGGVAKLLTRIEIEARAVKTDISTEKGRKAVAALAYKIAKSKTALDKMGKDLTEDWRDKTKLVNVERAEIRNRLDALADEVRLPLTMRENAERAMIAQYEADIANIDGIAQRIVSEWVTLPIETMTARFDEIALTRADDWQDFSARANQAIDSALAQINAAIDRREKHDAEQAELASLRLAAAEQARLDAAIRQAEHEAEIAANAAADAKRQAEESAERQIAEAAAALAQAERAKQDAEARERMAQARIEQQEREHIALAAQAEKGARDREIDTAARAARMEAAAIEAERKRVADERAASDAEALKRAANVAHRKRVNNAALEALVSAGLSKEDGTIALTAIAKGAIPHVSISY